MSQELLLGRLDRLYTAVVSDVCDQRGLRHQVMDPSIRPLYVEARFAAIAHTVRVVAVSALPAKRVDYYKGELAAIDPLRTNHAMIVPHSESCFWGELLATAARYRGALGVVVDGYVRNARRLIDTDFPVFSRGVFAADALGRMDVDAIGVPIVVGGVNVNPGDLILADFDGVVVVPADIAEDVVSRAEEKSSGEDFVRPRLEAGMSAAEAFASYGVL
jgi:4-hydroxy-4-methyl-2-oxoglutarate aldolase